MSRLFTVSFAAAAAASTLPVYDADAATFPIKIRVAGIALSTLAEDRTPEVKLYDSKGTFHAALTPFESKGGVYVSGGDINGDGRADIVVGQAKGSVVNVFDGAGLKNHLTLTPFGAGFIGGVRVAAGDVDGDGRAEIIAGAGPGAGPHVRVFSGNGATLHDFDAFDRGFTGGVNVATGDVNGDGRPDLIVSTALGDGSVRTYDGVTQALIGLLRPYGDDFKGGINVAGGRFRGQDALFTSKIAGDGSVRVISLSRGVEAFDFNPFGPDYQGEVSLGFTFNAGVDTLVVGQAKGNTVGFLDVSAPTAPTDFSVDAMQMPGGLFFKPFGADYSGGIAVAGLGPTAPIPEPATWAMMISGFGLAGAAARRRLRPAAGSVNAA